MFYLVLPPSLQILRLKAISARECADSRKWRHRLKSSQEGRAARRHLTSSQRAAFVPPLMDAIRAEAKKRQDENRAKNMAQNKPNDEEIPRGAINCTSGEIEAENGQSTSETDENGDSTGTEKSEPKTEAEPAPEDAEKAAGKSREMSSKLDNLSNLNFDKSALHVGVSHPFVGSIRKETGCNGYNLNATRTGANGRATKLRRRPLQYFRFAERFRAKLPLFAY